MDRKLWVVEREQILEEFRTGLPSRATAWAAAYVQKAPEDVAMLGLLAGGLLRTGHVGPATQLYEMLVSAHRSPDHLAGLGLARSSVGDLKSARALLREALGADRFCTRAWTGLSEVHRFRRDDPLLPRLRKALEDAPTDRAAHDLHYVMCKAMNDLGRWDDAWAEAEAGAARLGAAYDPGKVRRWAEEQAACVTPDLIAAKRQAEVPSQDMLFITGMPRSGSSVLEMMLAKLPGVAACGELSFVSDLAQTRAAQAAQRGLAQPTHGWLQDWEGEEIRALAAAHRADLAARAGQAALYIDKLPGNILCLPHIAILFPRAKIIRMRRDPLDACVSCYLGRFGDGNRYAYRPDWLAEAWAIHQGCGDRMEGLIPNPVLDVSLEALATEPEAQMRRVTGFLGLGWDDACLTPEGSPATCTTRSRGQVREGLNAASLGRWRRYGDRVRPLAEALMAQGVEIGPEAEAEFAPPPARRAAGG